MKIVYITSRPKIHDYPLWNEYHKLFPKDSVTFLCTDHIDVPIDRYSLKSRKSGFVFYSNKMHITDLENIINEADFIFLKSCVDSSVQNLIKNKTIFFMSENIIRVNNVGLYYRLIRLKRYLLLPYKRYELSNIDLNNTFFLCQSYNLISELKRLHIKTDRIFKFGYFNYYNYCSAEELSKERSDIVMITRNAKFKNNNIGLYFYKEVLKYKDYKLAVYGNCSDSFKDNIYKKQTCFYGEVENLIVQNKLKTYDMFIFPSKKGEGFGVALLEAMAAGCVVFVHKDCGAAKFVVKDGENGFIFSSKHSLKKKLKKYLSINQKDVNIIRKNAFDTIRLAWDPTVVAKRMKDFMLNIKNSKKNIYNDGPLSKS